MASPTRRRRSLYRFLPQWLTAKRLALSTVGLVALVGVAYGVRVLFALAHAAHENPLSVLADVVRGKDGSDVQTQIDSLNRINIALYGYGGPGHDGPYLTDSIMVISIQPQRGRPPQVA